MCTSQVSLEDMYNGATRQLALQKSVLCSKCEGIGGKKVNVVRAACVTFDHVKPFSLSVLILF